MRLIDADYLKEHLTACAINGMPLHRMYTELDELFEAIDDVPTVEPKQKTAKWLDNPITAHSLAKHCSRCGYVCLGYDSITGARFQYCPSCGASMKEKGEG